MRNIMPRSVPEPLNVKSKEDSTRRFCRKCGRVLKIQVREVSRPAGAKVSYLICPLHIYNLRGFLFGLEGHDNFFLSSEPINNYDSKTGERLQ